MRCVELIRGPCSKTPRRRSRTSMPTPASARRKIMKLANATAIASSPDGTAVSETSIVGSGMIEAAAIAVKW